MREALGLLTVLGGPRTPTPRALRWFPVVGAVLGAALGGLWWGAGEAFRPFVAAVVVVAADLAVTGMLHVDGLADTADGLLPHANRARRLDIMRAPDVGAYAVAVVVVVLLARTAALGSQSAEIGLLVGVWCASRTVAGVAPAFVQYARPDGGLATPLLTEPTAWWPAIALVPAFAVAVLAAGGPGAAAVASTVVGAAAVVWLGRVRIGGFTGDVLGAAIIVGETIGLVVAAARW